jgi:hypothetical protein
MTMRVQIQLRIVADDDSVISEDEILRLDKGDNNLEEIGLSLDEAKGVLAGTQERLVRAQAASFLARHRCCGLCAHSLRHKGQCRILFRTAFGTIPLVSPRVHRCACQPTAGKTFSPLGALFTEHTAPELVYLETRWASLVSFGLSATLLKDVLPIGTTANASAIRRNLHKVAARQEGERNSRPSDLMDGAPGNHSELPLPRDVIIVGVDGGYVRNWHDKKHNFEVLVGKSVLAEGDSRYFGLVQNQDDEPRRLREVLQDQGLPVNQAVTVLTDGGDSLHAFVGDLSADDRHYLDWFHIAMRLTGLTQYAKGLAHHNPIEAVALHSRLEGIKWRLWHGNADEALTRARKLAEDVADLDSSYPGLKRLVKATAGLATYIANNVTAIPNYGERWRTGEIISTAFVESTVNIVVSRRFAKKQQMQWSRTGAHRLLRTRTQTLNDTLRKTFIKWYPAMAANDDQLPTAAAVA